MATDSHTRDAHDSIEPDSECPECGRPAEGYGIVDARGRGETKFRKYVHEKSNTRGIVTVEDCCIDVIAR
jgi:hypothetical protein